MTYIASVLRRAGGGWAGDDLDLAGVEDLDELADRLREVGGAPVLCFLEEDDEYVAVVRVDGEDEPRVFVSDRRVLAGEGVAGRLLADTPLTTEAPGEPVSPDEDDDESGEVAEQESSRPEVEPAGEHGLLADLGVTAPRLLALCAEEGMLPSDVIFSLAEDLGAADVLEAVRGL